MQVEMDSFEDEVPYCNNATEKFLAVLTNA